MPHPNLSKEINDQIAESELQGGVWMKQPHGDAVKDQPYLPIGKNLMVQTVNTTYLIENREDGTYISGNKKYCPTPTKCNIHGSTWGGSMLKMGWIGVGMHLEFSTDKHPHRITTSEIQDVQEL